MFTVWTYSHGAHTWTSYTYILFVYVYTLRILYAGRRPGALQFIVHSNILVCPQQSHPDDMNVDDVLFLCYVHKCILRSMIIASCALYSMQYIRARVWSLRASIFTQVGIWQSVANFREHLVNFEEHLVNFREHSVNFRERSVNIWSVLGNRPTGCFGHELRKCAVVVRTQ
jgi:hypothetical protein